MSQEHYILVFGVLGMVAFFWFVLLRMRRRRLREDLQRGLSRFNQEIVMTMEQYEQLKNRMEFIVETYQPEEPEQQQRHAQSRTLIEKDLKLIHTRWLNMVETKNRVEGELHQHQTLPGYLHYELSQDLLLSAARNSTRDLLQQCDRAIRELEPS